MQIMNRSLILFAVMSINSWSSFRCMLKGSQILKIKNQKLFRTQSVILVFAFSLFTFHLSSCTQFWLNGILENADEVKIQFYSHEKNSADPTAIDITTKSTIEKISGYITDEVPTKTDCGYDGVLRFTSHNETTLDIEFVMNDTCQYAAFVMNNKVNYRKLSAEGVKYLRELNSH